MATETQLRDYLKRATVELTEVRRQLAAERDRDHEPIAITGMACRYPGGGDTPEGLWDLLAGARTGVVEVPADRWDSAGWGEPGACGPGAVYTRQGSFLDDVASWDAGLFGLSPQEALRMDPHQRLLMELVYEGFEDAGIAPARAAGSRTGVFVGHMDTVQYGRLETERHGPLVAADPYFGQGVSASLVAGRLAYHYDLRGPALTLDTACSSSLVGVHLAATALRRGECDLALAGGVFLLLQPDVYVQGCATSMLSPAGRCATFGAGADGYVLGEGGGLVVLERLSTARAAGRRVHAVLRGSAVNQDGRSNGLTAPNRTAQVDVLRRAQAAARVHADDIDYVEAHGSGTSLGDAIELGALHDVFAGRTRPLPVGAVKTNLGHTQAAAGVAGLIKTVLVLQHGQVPTNLHGAEPAAAVPADGTVCPVTAAAPLSTTHPAGCTTEEQPGGRPALAGVSSFGWSGTNAHVVVSAAPVEAGATGSATADACASRAVLALSAATPVALQRQAERLAAWAVTHPGVAVADIARTLAEGRTAHEFRLPVSVAADGSDLGPALAAAAQAAPGVRRTRSRPRVAFLLAGTGDHYAGAVAALYRTEPVFTAAVDSCLEHLRDRCGIDLGPLLTAPAVTGPGLFAGAADDADPLHRAETSHPYVFTIGYALAQLLAARGVRPDLLLGYSLGEHVAACLAGVLTLPDALTVVVERARLIAAAPAGRMLAVAAAEPTVRAAMATAAVPDVEQLDVAALNGPAMTVLSGTPRAVQRVAAALADAGVAARPLRSAHAFHSALLEPVRDKLAALLRTVPLSPPRTTIVSNRTGVALTADQATDPEYWADHLLAPVRFADGVDFCGADGVDVYVELGCGQTLGGLVRQLLPAGGDVEVVGTVPFALAAAAAGGSAAGSDLASGLHDGCGRLWQAGLPVDWTTTVPAGARIVSLPGYPFQRTRFWPDAGAGAGAGVAAPTRPDRPAADPEAGPGEHVYRPGWRRDRTPPPVGELSAGALLVLDGDPELRDALLGRAAVLGCPAAVVGPEQQDAVESGTATRYADGTAALRSLPADGPLTVVDLGGPDPEPGPTRRVDRAIATAVTAFGVAHDVLRGLAAAGGERPIRWLSVSRGGREIVGGDAVAPGRTIGHGLARSARHELPGLSWTGVDLDPAPTAAAIAVDQLLAELGAPVPTRPGVTGWRQGRRWQSTYDELTELSESHQPSTAGGPHAGPGWRADGVYVVTGGTRGLGRALARHLVAAGVRRLVLVSRSGVDADAAELRAGGAEVLVLAAHMAEPGQLRGALARARQHFGRVTGVVHAAGAPAAGLLAGTSRAAAERVLAPKLRALGPLAELVTGPAEHRPELVVLYSSAITAHGGIGESDYCAANTVLDAYADALDSAAGPATRVLAVAWGPWRHDSWQAEDTAGELAARAGTYRERYGFTDDGGCRLLDRLVSATGGAVLAVGQPLEDIQREWAAALDLGELLAGAARPTTDRFPRPALRVAFAAPRGEVERTVAGTWAAFLGLAEVGRDDPFFDLGGNSLVGLAMVRDLEQALHRSIPPALLYAHPTVAGFAAALGAPDAGPPGATGGAVPGAGPALQTSTDRGRRRRQTRGGSARRGGTT